ncbi:MAG TPA: sorbosone dehydrogenase family protein, partial [Stellaceae bacterium]|nr:sorbosone dehydrogenase family protein [Stellaceae bacterium]
RHITAADLPAPYATQSATNHGHVVPRPKGAMPQVPRGFTVSEFATGLSAPRLLRVAPNGDIFVAETDEGDIRVFHADAKGRKAAATVYAKDLDGPFGLAFYPPGPHPEYLYVANAGAVVRFPYRRGDRGAPGKPETIVAKLPTGGHSTRDVLFSPDGKKMYVSVGSESNVQDGLWGSEKRRADILEFAPDGGGGRRFATGLRNPVEMAIHPLTGDLWTVVNERDGLGDDLPPDYATRVRDGAFYGWPWYYIGAHQDPRHQGEHPELRDKIIVPDVLIQPHSAPLGLAVYTGKQFPASYRNDIFVALHGSWNRSQRTGYKVVRVILRDGKPTGEYEDFLTGFVTKEGDVWARPVGVAVALDGALLVSDDAGGTVWRVAYTGAR